MASLATILAGIRRAESGSFKGNYAAEGPRLSQGRPRGAYGILDRNWDRFAAQAGVPGANWRDKSAQDRVAATMIQSYYERYGSWNAAVAAWVGGPRSADSIMRKGHTTNPQIARYVQSVANFQKIPDVNNYPLNASAMRGGSGVKKGGWAFPVAGKSEWSGGSYMDKHTKGDRSHHAIDVYAAAGTPIVAPMGGTITKIGVGGKLGGNTVSVMGTDGVTYYFAHMKGHSKNITKGMKISAGTHLGTVGNSGSARGTSPHLHFSMKRGGKAINPREYLAQAEGDSGTFAGMDPYEAAIQPEGVTGKQTIDPASAGFGQSMPEAMIQTASNAIAGGKRQDSRMWRPEGVAEDLIERDVANLELELDEKKSIRDKNKLAEENV